MQNDALESAIRELKLTGESQWTQLLSSAMDEQPHLMAFLINLSDDFSEEVHEQLLKVFVILSTAFRKAGIEIDLITPAGLDKVIEEKVETYEALEEEDTLDQSAMNQVANSPMVFDRIRTWVRNELGESMPLLDESQANINLMVDVIISAIEEHAVDPGSKDKETTTDA